MLDVHVLPSTGTSIQVKSYSFSYYADFIHHFSFSVSILRNKLISILPKTTPAMHNGNQEILS